MKRHCSSIPNTKPRKKKTKIQTFGASKKRLIDWRLGLLDGEKKTKWVNIREARTIEIVQSSTSQQEYNIEEEEKKGCFDRERNVLLLCDPKFSNTEPSRDSYVISGCLVLYGLNWIPTLPSKVHIFRSFFLSLSLWFSESAVQSQSVRFESLFTPLCGVSRTNGRARALA